MPAIRTALLVDPTRTRLAFVAVTTGWVGLWDDRGRARPPLPTIPAHHLRGRPDLWDRYVPDAHAAQLLTDEHLRRVGDLSQWEIIDVGSGRHLVEAPDVDRWLGPDGPDDDTVETARLEFGGAIVPADHRYWSSTTVDKHARLHRQSVRALGGFCIQNEKAVGGARRRRLVRQWYGHIARGGAMSVTATAVEPAARHHRDMKVNAGGIEQNLLVRGPLDGPPVLLVHGNCSSADFWAPLLRHLPENWRIVAPDLRGYGATEAAPVDATLGLGNFTSDVLALLDHPEVYAEGGRPVVVGHSMGGGIAMKLAIAAADRIAALVLESPLSPYGFGVGGAGSVNADFVARLAAGDRGSEPTSPRTVLRTCYVADPASLGDDEELLLDTILSTVIGEANYPGDSVASPHWPGVGAGTRGVANAMDPAHHDIAAAFVALSPKPPVTWVRGDKDVIVSDTSSFDLAYLGQLGEVPGWPGADACPPQPMVTQTREVLDRYGPYKEVVYAGVGHSPHIERPAEFADLLRQVFAA